MSIETYKLADDKAAALEGDLNLVENETTATLKTVFKDAVEKLDKDKLAQQLYNKFFKDGNVLPTATIQSDPSYTFLVQTVLDSVSQGNRYENFLRGKDDIWGIDAKYGQRTRNAVRQFQTDAEIDVDGIAGEQTIKAMYEVLTGIKTLDFTKPLIDTQEVYDAKNNTDATNENLESDSNIDIQDYTITYGEATVTLKLNSITREFLTDLLSVYPDVFYGGKNFDNFKTDDKGNLIASGNLRKEKWLLVDYGIPVKEKDNFTLNDIDIALFPDAIRYNGKEYAKISASNVVWTVDNATETIDWDVFNTLASNIKSLFTKEKLETTKKFIAGSDKNLQNLLQSVNQYNISRLYWNPVLTLSIFWLWTTWQASQIKINMHDIYVQWNLDYNMLYSQIQKSLLDKLQEKAYKETLREIAKKSYSFQDLFPGVDYDIPYQTYFNKFSDKKVVIDSDIYNSPIKDNRVTFSFDDSGFNEGMNKNKELDLTLVTTSEGKLDETKLKKTIAQFVKEIVDMQYRS